MLNEIYYNGVLWFVSYRKAWQTDIKSATFINCLAQLRKKNIVVDEIYVDWKTPQALTIDKLDAVLQHVVIDSKLRLLYLRNISSAAFFMQVLATLRNHIKYIDVIKVNQVCMSTTWRHISEMPCIPPFCVQDMEISFSIDKVRYTSMALHILRKLTLIDCIVIKPLLNCYGANCNVFGIDDLMHVLPESRQLQIHIVTMSGLNIDVKMQLYEQLAHGLLQRTHARLQYLCTAIPMSKLFDFISSLHGAMPNLQDLHVGILYTLMSPERDVVYNALYYSTNIPQGSVIAFNYESFDHDVIVTDDEWSHMYKEKRCKQLMQAIRPYLFAAKIPLELQILIENFALAMCC